MKPFPRGLILQDRGKGEGHEKEIRVLRKRRYPNSWGFLRKMGGKVLEIDRWLMKVGV